MKTTVNLGVRGTSLTAMVEDAKKKLDELHPGADWEITELQTYGGGEDVADESNGFVTLWSGQVTAITTVEL